ncbi:MAG: sialate O-acetylesterase [Thermoguttaceae bacterium]|nr:sialate O-acetylesterase [Thermoguttaceae bacterium]
MQQRRLFSLLLTLLLFAIPSYTQPVRAQNNDDLSNAAVELPSKEKFRIVVLAGQSNMAGRGFVEEEDKIPIPRVYMLSKEGQWVPAVDPVHYDKPSAGVGPGRAFAQLLVESDPTIAVGLVPTACGGSSIDHWEPGVFFNQTKSYPFDDAISRTKRALEDGELEAILWRQGESDATVQKAVNHAEKLQTFFERFRKEFDAPNLPILIGELFYEEETDGSQAIHRAQLEVVEKLQPAAFVSAEGTVLNPDRIHFDRQSQIEQGKRFFKALQTLKEQGNDR